MTAEYYPLQFLLLTVSGWVNREQQRTIEYLIEDFAGNVSASAVRTDARATQMRRNSSAAGVESASYPNTRPWPESAFSVSPGRNY